MKRPNENFWKGNPMFPNKHLIRVFFSRYLPMDIEAFEVIMLSEISQTEKASSYCMIFLPGKSQGQRSLAGHSPWGRKELDMTEQPSTHTYTVGYIYI